MSHNPQFQNAKVDLEILPEYELVELQKLEPNYLKVRMIQWGIWSLIIIIIGIVVFFLINEESKSPYTKIIIPVLAVLTIVPFIFSYYGFRMKAYALREKDILFRKGLIWRSTTIIPFNRIQHSEVNHGPIDRMFGLSSLKLFTAGGSTSDLSIPGLSDSRANQLKDYITRKTGMDEEE